MREATDTVGGCDVWVLVKDDRAEDDSGNSDEETDSSFSSSSSSEDEDVVSEGEERRSEMLSVVETEVYESESVLGSLLVVDGLIMGWKI